MHALTECKHTANAFYHRRHHISIAFLTTQWHTVSILLCSIHLHLLIILSKQQLQIEDEFTIYSSCLIFHIDSNLLRNLHTVQTRVCTPLENKSHICTVHGPNCGASYLWVVVLLAPTLTSPLTTMMECHWFRLVRLDRKLLVSEMCPESFFTDQLAVMVTFCPPLQIG